MATTTASRPSKINFYQEPPAQELSIDDFETFALRRLKVLRKIEHVKMLNLSLDQSRSLIDQTIKKENLADCDELSHFILRLSYCQTEELRRWFLQHESALFAHRLRGANNLSSVLSSSVGRSLVPISKARKLEMQDKLLSVGNLTPVEFANSQFYSVPFTQAPELVAHRQCLVEKGQAYVPTNKMVSILTAKFRTQLARTLALLANSTEAFWSENNSHGDSPESTRLGPLLTNMHRSVVPAAAQTESDLNLTAATVPQTLAHMPLCMRSLHMNMTTQGKLKHQGRLQYGFFLRSAGLNKEELVAFFAKHFTRFTSQQFQKQYAPSFAHMFKKASGGYSGYGCPKIVHMPTPAQDQAHGCPYKTLDARNLSQLLSSLRIGSPQDRTEMVRLATQDQQYALACVKHFAVTHASDTPMDNVGNHPNAWYRASLQAAAGTDSSDKQQQ